jgi:aryl-alcohol dehydrogenase-like predicted oxidoreductase
VSGGLQLFYLHRRDPQVPIEEMGVTPAQLALAWLIARQTVPIPGTTNIRHLKANAAAAAITLTSEQIRDIEELVPADAAAGERLSAAAARWVGK